MICEVCTLNPATIKHHKSYFPEETVGVCEGCHKIIHSWRNPELSKKYIKYKQGDAQIFYAQKNRIDNFIHSIGKRNRY